jgi:alpha-D-ribose 1-methylphosphonate 5-triphosphate diphosphatase
MTYLIRNADIVLENNVMEKADLLISDNKINKISANISQKTAAELGDYKLVEAEGKVVIPGLIDIHSDAIEKAVQPRPSMHFSPEMAVNQLEKNLISTGITTMYHSLSLSDGSGIRSTENVVDIINFLKDNEKSYLRRKVHLRLEKTNLAAYSVIEDMIDKGKLDLLSIMDHTPGQGQYKTVEEYQEYLNKTYNLNEKEIDDVIKSKLNKKRKVSRSDLNKIIELAVDKSISVASHDDDDPEYVAWIKDKGANILEFPMKISAAEYGISQDMMISVGAPNIVNGGSHNGNLSALDLIKDGLANIICSDYYAAAMINSIFITAEEINDLAEAVKMATLYPAEAVGLDNEIGSIEEGKTADLIVLDIKEDYPAVEEVYINGENVYKSKFWDN